MFTPVEKKIKIQEEGAPVKNTGPPNGIMTPIKYRGLFNDSDDDEPPRFSGKPRNPTTPVNAVYCALSGPFVNKSPPRLERKEKFVNYYSPPRVKRSSDQITPQGNQTWNTDETNSTPADFNSLLRGFFVNGSTKNQNERLKMLRVSHITPPRK